MRLCFVSCAVLALGMAGAVQAQSNVTAATAQAPQSTLTRAQVVADLEMWHASGMSFVPHPSGYSDSMERPEYQRYQQMRAEATATAQAVGVNPQPVQASAAQAAPAR